MIGEVQVEGTFPDGTKLVSPRGNIHNCAATCDFKHCDILISLDSDEPVQPPFKLRHSK